MAEAGNRMTRALIGLIVAAGIGWYFWGGGLDRQAANNVQKSMTRLHRMLSSNIRLQRKVAKNVMSVFRHVS
ncbi:hypothetical protein WJ970_24330 [Achromobacter xylosoxidans]